MQNVGWCIGVNLYIHSLPRAELQALWEQALIANELVRRTIYA